MAACENGDIESVKLLINAQADIKRTGEVCNNNFHKFDISISLVWKIVFVSCMQE